MSGTAAPTRPSLSWRLGSLAVVSSVSALARGFLYGFNSVEVTGLNNLLGVLDRRKLPGGRDRGLLTVCNHVGVLDDPVIWGILPMRYALDVENMRWSLGAHDICFKNAATSKFFSLGQVLPTHRYWHSSHGGPHQPTISQALKLLTRPTPIDGPESPTYSTNGKDSFLAPAAYSAYRNAWVHVFPEACCHQNPESTLRYFKWGISRLILESDPAPEFVPMFVHGTQLIMPEDRGFPRFLPRIGNKIRFIIGEPTDVDRLFGEQRRRWRKLVANSDPDALRDSHEASQLRREVAKGVRDEVGKLREKLGLAPEQDETAALAETWSKEPNKRKFKSPVDGSLTNRNM